MTSVERVQSGQGRTAPSGDPALGAPEPAAAGLQALRTIALPPDPTSPARARVVLRRVLREADRLDCLDAAELACTELVTNAVLHAHTTVEVTVEVTATVRVEVHDASRVMPDRRHYDTQATTGRGLALVAAVTDDYGVADLGPDGKTVWFVVGGPDRERNAEQLLAAWDLDEPLVPPGPPSPGRRVRLLDLPTALWLAARQHHDALLRELALYLARHDDVQVDAVGTDRARFLFAGAVGAVVEQQRRDDLAAGADRLPDAGTLPWSPRPVDLDLTVPPGLARDFAAMQDTLDTAERLARAGRLLMPPGLPEVVAVRDWACEQVVAQLAGIAAVPWPGTDLERFTREAHDRPGSGPAGVDVAAVTRSSAYVAAADESNRLVAVSEPLARLLGWRAEELVGRRIAALIPHRLREAHVAGFTRHQSTGEARILGVPLTVPVLRADGTEVTSGLRIDQVAGPSGRTGYVAWFEPTTDGGAGA